MLFKSYEINRHYEYKSCFEGKILTKDLFSIPGQPK